MVTKRGDSGPNTLIGSEFADILKGFRGKDRLEGLEGDDVLFGGKGADHIIDGSGSDEVYGGDGNDVIENLGGTDSFYGGNGTDTLITDVSAFNPDFTVLFNASTGEHGRFEDSPFPNDTIGGIENFTLIGVWDGRIIGDDANNVFKSDAGDDLLRGKAGADVLSAGRGADILEGGSGADKLNGGKGSDILDGGKGRDMLFGGKGADTFVFDTASGSDQIRDFQDGIDEIQITSGAERFRDLDLSQDGSDVVVSFANVEITIADIDLEQLTGSDFSF